MLPERNEVRRKKRRMDWEWLCKFETCNTEEKHPYNVYRWVRLKKTLSIVFLFTGGGETNDTGCN